MSLGPDERPDTVATSVVIVAYRTRALILEAIASLQRETGIEIIVWDNASADGTVEAIRRAYPSVVVTPSPSNLGFAAAVNRAVGQARGSEYLLLNPDARLTEGALDLLRACLRHHPRAGVVGPSLRYPNGQIQHSAFAFPSLAQVFLDLFPITGLLSTRLNGRYPATSNPRRVDHPLGACMLIRAQAWKDVGPLDEKYFMYVEEVDWCRRARQKGWEAWLEPRAVAIHHGGESTRQHADRMFVELWRSRLLYYGRFHSAGYNRLIRILLRLGMKAEARRARRTLRGAQLESRLAAAEKIRALPG